MYAPILKEIQKTFMQKLADQVDAGEEFDMTKFTFAVILRIVFGADLPVFEKEGERYLYAWEDLIALSGILALLQRGLGDWAMNLAPGVKRRMLAGADVLHQIIYDNIRRRERGEKAKEWSIFEEAYDNGLPTWMCENNYAEIAEATDDHACELCRSGD